VMRRDSGKRDDDSDGTTLNPRFGRHQDKLTSLRPGPPFFAIKALEHRKRKTALNAPGEDQAEAQPLREDGQGVPNLTRDRRNHDGTPISTGLDHR
jgi:hypothetical protein